MVPPEQAANWKETMNDKQLEEHALDNWTSAFYSRIWGTRT